MRYEYICKQCGGMVELDTTISDRDNMIDTDECHCGGTYRRSVGNNGGFRMGSGYTASNGYSGLLGDDETFKATFGDQS